MVKYELIPLQLMHKGIITQNNLFKPEPVNERWILETHDASYWQHLKELSIDKQHERRIGFPVSKELVYRETVIVNGTIQCAEHALQNGMALNVAGGTHHAGTNWGEGFCLLNDIAVAANYLLQTKKSERILVIDLDVHQGNGTAQIFENNPNVFTLSIHGEKNFPFIKEKSNVDIGLPDGIEDAAYLRLLQDVIPPVIKDFKPDFVFYQSGVDILESDKLGKLKVSMEGCRKRDEFVFELCRHHQLPVAVTMGGGYSEDIRLIVDAHCQTYEEAFRIFDQ